MAFSGQTRSLFCALPDFPSGGFSSLSKSPAATAGFSLIEAVITLGIFAFIMLGIIGGTFHARKSSEATVHTALADSVTLGFLEQIKNIDYPVLRNAALGVGGSTITLFVDSAQPIQVTLNQTDFTDLQVPLDTDLGGNVSRTMDYSFRPRVIVDENLPLLTIVVEYQWTTPLVGLRQHTMSVSRSAVTQF